MTRPRVSPAAPAAAVLLAVLLLPPAARAAGTEVDGRVGLGVMGLIATTGTQTGGAYDLRTMLDLRLGVDNMGGKPVGIRADGDLFFDIDDTAFRTYRLLDLNLHLTPKGGPLTLTLGRQRVADSTEELVDGVGVLVALGKGFELGGYGGLIPDPFTTLASVSTYGGGLVFGVTTPRFRLGTAAGIAGRVEGFDHGYANVSAMVMPHTAISIYGRAKVQLFAEAPSAGIADAIAAVSIRPWKVLRLRASYNTYSSERYISLLDRNPALSRFAARAEDLDLLDEVPNDRLDRTLYHQLGADVDLRSADKHVWIGGRYRYRFAPDPDDYYQLAEGHGGPVNLGRGGASIRLAGRFIHASGRDIGQGEIGLETPIAKRRLDLGVYALISGSPSPIASERATIGVYCDLFVTAWLGKGWSLAAAARVGWEDTPASSAVTVDGLLKLQTRFGSARRSYPSRPVVAEEEGS